LAENIRIPFHGESGCKIAQKKRYIMIIERSLFVQI